MKILLVEPDPDFENKIAKDIVELGYDLITTRSCQEGLEVIKKNGIRLVILERVVPGENPVELCRQVREAVQKEIIKNIFIILVTDRNREYDLLNALSAGADDYLLKPFSFLELKTHLQNGQRMIVVEDNYYQLTSFDPATDLWRKEKIVDFLEEELNRGWREVQPTGLIMVDIDHFKRINDSYGQVIGDKVLAKVAVRLKKILRPYDKIGRYGGDEMLIVLPNCSLDDVNQIAERLRSAACEKQVQVETTVVSVTISLGGTSSDNLTRTSGVSLVQATDKALYLAKNGGRNRAVVIKPTTIVDY